MPFAGTDKIDPQISPMVQRQGGGGGSFTNLPLNFTDFDNSVVVALLGGTADAIVRFRGSGAIPNTTQGLVQHTNSSGSFISAPNQPNWHNDVGDPGVPNAGEWSVALTALEILDGPITINDFRNPVGAVPTLGAFFRLNVFQRDWTMFGVPNNNNGTRRANLTFDIAQWDDTSNVQARATILYEYIRGTG